MRTKSDRSAGKSCSRAGAGRSSYQPPAANKVHGVATVVAVVELARSMSGWL